MSQPDVSCFIEQLLDGVEVEFKALSDVFDLKNGYTPSRSKKEYWENGNIPWFRMDDLRENGSILSDSLQKVSFQAAKGGKLFSANSIIVSTSATIGEHALITVPFLANQRFTCLTLKSDFSSLLDIKFLYYYAFLLSDWCKKNTTQSSFASVVMDGFKKYPIPIPCPDNPEKSLEIQAEIVRILDAFTAMTAELTTELNLRQQQYNYYRDQLLSFEEGEVEWSCLNELTSRTSNIRWQETDEIYQYIDLSSVSIENNSIAQTTEIDALNAPSRAQKLVQEHDVIFATTRPTQMRICLIPSDYDGAIASTGYCVLRAIQEKVLSKWIYYCLTSTCFKCFLEENQSGSAYPAISDSKLKEYSIPVPSLEEQARIVAILDKFDTLTNSITKGLPREIELRQKQYEYYRNLLLSFPKSEDEVVA